MLIGRLRPANETPAAMGLAKKEAAPGRQSYASRSHVRIARLPVCLSRAASTSSFPSSPLLPSLRSQLAPGALIMVAWKLSSLFLLSLSAFRACAEDIKVRLRAAGQGCGRGRGRGRHMTSAS